jgi:hypothetical protein
MFSHCVECPYFRAAPLVWRGCDDHRKHYQQACQLKGGDPAGEPRAGVCRAADLTRG